MDSGLRRSDGERKMTWEPLSELGIWEYINNAEDKMNLKQKRLWEIVKIIPEKWEQDDYGKVSGGFWVVAIFGNQVIWYNDIEYGFNRSTYYEYGKINEFWCNQDELEVVVQNLLYDIEMGVINRGNTGGPRAGECSID